MFNEICIYEAKIDKQEEIETLMREVADFYKSQEGVIDVKYKSAHIGKRILMLLKRESCQFD